MRIRSFIVLAFIFLAASAFHADAVGKYRSSLLERMAGAMDIDSLCAGLGEGFHFGIVSWNDVPVSVVKEGGEVRHIGYSLFPVSTRSLLPEPVCDFLERYALELTLPLIREKSPQIQMLEDGVEFNRGTLPRMISAMSRDDNLDVELTNIRDRRYCFNWKNGLDSGCVVFPIDWQLLSGRSMTENEERLPREVLRAPSLMPVPLPEPADLVQAEDGLYSTDEGYYYFNTLSSNRYYTVHRNTVHLMDDPKKTNAFAANLLTGAGIDNMLTLNMKMRTYGLKSVIFKTSLDQWLSFCLKSGCKPYWGVIAEDGDILEGELILRNQDCGYNHVVRLWIPLSVLKERRGEIQARLLPYVPTHGLRYLFEETSL